MNISTLPLPGLLLCTPALHEDSRGSLYESFRADLFNAAAGPQDFVQDNHVTSLRGALRGLHYQLRSPQGKLVRVTAGAVYDVAVDLRRSSFTFGQWCGVELSAQNRCQLWVPPGFAHGFVTLSATSDVHYKLTALYDPQDQHVLHYAEPRLNIPWPLQEVLVSEQDRAGKNFAELETFA